jgi:hypothetical protein
VANKTKLTKALMQMFMDNLEIGMSRTDCCQIIDISYQTFSKWMGITDNPKYKHLKKPDFEKDVFAAEMRCKKRCIQIIQKAAIETWTAAAWWLERKYRDEFALRHELTGPKGIPLAPLFTAQDKGL